jgi:lipoprotein-anchoring transpeptidase ErfK/SrfK
MRIAGFPQTLLVTLAVRLFASVAFGLGAPLRAQEANGDQADQPPAPAKINASLESVINASNSRVHISLSKQRAYLMVGDEIYIDFPISSGKRSGMTPTGTFRISQKDPDHRSSVYGEFVDWRGRVVRSGVSTKVDSAPRGTRYRGAQMKWFMRLTDSGIGMHVGILPGYPASHGCIRLPADIAPLIYQKVGIGTPAVIES